MNLKKNLKGYYKKASCAVASRRLSKIVSTDRFIFVDIPRTGSTNLRVQIGKKHPLYRKRHAIDPTQSSTGTDHSLNPCHRFACEWKAILPADIWQSCYKFAFCRNPFARVKSLHSYLTCYESKTIGFDDFIYSLRAPRYHDRNFPHSSHLRSKIFLSTQSSFICDADGGLLVDKVYCYENYTDSVKDLNSFLGMELDGTTRVQVSKTQSDENEKSCWTDELAGIVVDYYRDDFNLLGYSTCLKDLRNPANSNSII